MFWKRLKHSIAVVVITSYMVVVFGNGCAPVPAVTPVVNPGTPDVYAGSEPVALTTEASGAGLKYRWELHGPGKIEGTGAAVLYNIPDTIEGESAQATITATGTDEAGQETTETFTFHILARKIPAPEPAKKGMSTTDKILIVVFIVSGPRGKKIPCHQEET